jgi:hypothetical protein
MKGNRFLHLHVITPRQRNQPIVSPIPELLRYCQQLDHPEHAQGVLGLALPVATRGGALQGKIWATTGAERRARKTWPASPA